MKTGALPHGGGRNQASDRGDFFNKEYKITSETAQLSEEDYEKLVSLMERLAEEVNPAPEGKWMPTYHSWEVQFFYQDAVYLSGAAFTKPVEVEELIKEIVRLSPMPIDLIGAKLVFDE